MSPSTKLFRDSIAIDELLSQNFLGPQRSSYPATDFFEDEDESGAIYVLDDHQRIVGFFLIDSVMLEILVVIVRIDHISDLLHPIEHELSELYDIERSFANQLIDYQSFVSSELDEMQSIAQDPLMIFIIDKISRIHRQSHIQIGGNLRIKKLGPPDICMFEDNL